MQDVAERSGIKCRCRHLCKCLHRGKIPGRNVLTQEGDYHSEKKMTLKQISPCISSQDTTQLGIYIIPERMREEKKGEVERRKEKKKWRKEEGWVDLKIN